MQLTKHTKHHPAHTILEEYAMQGCPVDCRVPWMQDHLEAVIQRGNHPSANTLEAHKLLWAEAMEKFNQGTACIINWDDIKHNHHQNLKVSPLAAVPHKSRTLWVILDLSFQLCTNSKKFPSVNLETIPLATHKSMEQMGHVLPQFIYKVANSDPAKDPLFFAKWDIKDGFWCLVVAPDDAWYFCYILLNTDVHAPTQLVVPTCLQMGWCEAPPFFCTTSETTWDIVQELLDSNQVLPQYPLEHHCIPASIILPQLHESAITCLNCLPKVYMDDFLGMTQAPTHCELVHFTQVVLHGIHSIFPSPGLQQNHDDEPISKKKLQQGDGLWNTQKEILGWLFDRTTKCISLPADKVATILHSLKELSCHPTIHIETLECLNGKLMHTVIGIPNRWGLILPIITTITAHSKTKSYKEKTICLNVATHQALTDWHMLLPAATHHPIPCSDLIPAKANFGGYCDASKQGARGIWYGLKHKLPPLVWQVKVPLEIQQEVVY